MNKVYDDWFINENNEYVCECGRIFKKVGSFRSHRRFCDCHEHGYNYEVKKRHIKHNNNHVYVDNYKNNNGSYVCECGKTFDKVDSISAHFGHCEEHKIKNNIPTKDRVYPKTNHWSKTFEEMSNISKKAHETLKKKVENSEYVYKSHKHTEESREKLRISMINKHKEMNYSANYSLNACKFIDDLNIKNGWNLQHALNGGEYIVKGYYLDGYDKENNIAFEYDERKHYSDPLNSTLKVRDQIRQYIIMYYLKCRMFRYNEYIDKLYEVTDPKMPKCETIEDAIQNNNIDYTSRETIKNSLKSLGLSIKLYDVYVNEHPKSGLVSYPGKNKNINSNKENKHNTKNKKLEIEERKLNRIRNKNIEIEEKIKFIHSLDIDFSKWGWVGKVAKACGTNSTRLKKFMETYDKGFYDKCYNKDKAINKTLNTKNKQKMNEAIKNESIDKRKNMIIESGIKHSTYGWQTKLSKLLGISRQSVNSFLKRHMTYFYNT